MKATINQVATYIAYHYGLDREDVAYMLAQLKKKQMNKNINNNNFIKKIFTELIINLTPTLPKITPRVFPKQPTNHKSTK